MCGRSAQDRAAVRRLCKGEDVEELDVQTVLVEPGKLRDPVALLEAEDELLRRVVGALELVEPEGQPAVCSPSANPSSASTLFRRSNSVPCRSESSQPWRGVTQSSSVAARIARSSSTSTSMTTSSYSSGVGRGLT